MLSKRVFRAIAVAAIVSGMIAGCGEQQQQKSADPGVTDTEIKIGNTNPYSGPASAYGTIGRASAAYFKMINEQGGINGRTINFVTLDDGYSPPKTVEQIRKLVEEEQVFFLAGTLGTPTNTAIHKYVNAKQVPHIFVNTGAAKWADPENFPWTMGFNLSYLNEAKIYAQYLLKNKPDAKIAILYQNDDYGKDYVHGLKLGLGDKADSMIVAEVSYEVTDPTIDSQIVSLQASGADTFFNVTTPKFAAQAIRKVYDIGWRPLHILNNVSSSVGSVLKPAGLEKSLDIITAVYLMDPIDPQWADTQAVKDYKAWIEKYFPDGNIADVFNVNGYVIAYGVAEIVRRCGDDLTRANVMKQMASIKDFEVPMMLPGVKWNTSASDFSLIESAQLARFDGAEWKLFGEIVGN
ncbi:MAG: branched-chain amino acid ABC transporter substrate-binding protein [Betaproteobacteria bacterium SG8_40]|nr:MAG: branched-chain amino acid ABC transporter substrate-binding protein [Betaproteobacteria bacterium SG8_40]